MYLHSIKIKGFRKLKDVEVILSDTSFLIGANNSGKSSVLKAIELLLSAEAKTAEENFYKETNNSQSDDIMELIGEFRGIDKNVIGSKEWRGFNKKRVLKYQEKDGSEGWRIFYKKTFNKNGKAEFSMKELTLKPKECFLSANTYQDLVNGGLSIEALNISENDLLQTIKKKTTFIDELYEIEDFWDFCDDNESWFPNPGGFASNVVSKLPKFLLIPPYDKSEEYGEKKGALFDILDELFKEVKESSDNYKRAEEALNALAKEFNPEDDTNELGKMIKELNETINSVFPCSTLKASAELTGKDALKPNYRIELGSNISTKPEYQGTGQLRAAVFALLQYREKRLREKGQSEKDLIIGFEEPELYMHPHAAYQMKEVIYDLSQHSQIICSTHSPYMIDLSKNRKQVLNKLHIEIDSETKIEEILIFPFNLSEEFNKLQNDDKTYIKMLLKMDDEISKIFFSKKILIIEGDTEEIVIKQFISLIDNKDAKNKLLSEWSILKARGKPVIISIIKYLKAMSFKEIKVMHDADAGKAGAECFNDPIREALCDDDKIFKIENCIENLLGYNPPNSEKPFTAYKETLKWQKYEDIPKKCKDTFEQIFNLNQQRG